MSFGRFCDRFGELLRHYNLFIPNEDHYDDDDDGPSKDPSAILKHQRYATRVYVLLLIVTFYVVFVMTFVNTETRLMTISNPTVSLYERLHREHAETLSCPCSTSAIPYGTFVTSMISFHPICSSGFVSKEWIHALYLWNASAYLMMDFRTTASSQFKVLSGICWFLQQTVSQVKDILNNVQFISVEVLAKKEIQSQIDTTIAFALASTSVQTSVLLYLLQITTRSNSLVSALNTNAAVQMEWMPPSSRSLFVSSTTYFENGSSSNPKNTYTCDVTDITRPAGFYSAAGNRSWTNQAYLYGRDPPDFQLAPPVKVDGFFGGCTPLEAVLESTFACLHNTSCLQLLADYFPGISQLNSSYVAALPLSQQKNATLNERLVDLLVEEWATTIDDHKYFSICAPTFCTFSETASTSFSYAITLLLSLYGGLIIILRLVATLLATLILKFRQRSAGIPKDMCIHLNVQWLRKLNLFKSARKRTAVDVQQQRISTRLYLILFAGSTLLLLLYTSLRVETLTKAESTPPLPVYQHLQKTYPDTLRCLCTKEIIPYSQFITLSATLHEVCSSDFVSESWLAMLTVIKDSWKGLGAVHFRLLSALCRLSNRTIDDAVRQFTMRSLVTMSVLPELNFAAESNAAFNQFKQTLVVNFGLLVDVVRLLTQVDQPFQIPQYQYAVADNVFNVPRTLITTQRPLEVSFRLMGPQLDPYALSPCLCATNPQCQASYNAILVPFESAYDNTANGSIKAPGMAIGCFAMESLLLSTLECIYSDICLSEIYSQLLYKTVDMKSWFDTYPLLYKPASTRFALNASLESIVSELMIEQWSLSFSFDRYYRACAPRNCTYSYPARTTSAVRLVIMLMSCISGLTIVLRFVADLLIKAVFRFRRPKIEPQRAPSPLLGRMRSIPSTLVTLVRTKLIDLNMFPLRHFGSNVDRATGKRLGQLTTRLYLVLLVVGLAVLLLHTIVRPEKLTKTFSNPTLKEYTHLLIGHNDTLQCPCSSISSTYDRYVTITPVFHQVCTSAFTTDEWRTMITAALIPDLSSYAVQDYRRFLSAHLQFLNGLCSLSTQLVSDSVRQLLSSVWTTTLLQSPSSFQTHVDTLVQQSKSSTPSTFFRLLSLLRSMNHGNALTSTYGTNYGYYFTDWFNVTFLAPQLRTMGRTKAAAFGECSCALESNCTAPAAFINANASNIIPVKGFRMGCTPSESFLASTLECFYDSACLELISPWNYTSRPLPSSASRFPQNATIMELAMNLFVETWSTTVNHSAHFEQCSPKHCSYTYIQKVSSIDTVTLIFGLYGGLNVVLRWLCPGIIHILAEIYGWRKKRSSHVQPPRTQPTNTTMTTTLFHTNTTGKSPSAMPTAASSPNSSSKFTQLPVLLMNLFLTVLVGMALVGPCIYLSRRVPSNSATTPINDDDTTVSPTTSLTSSGSSCDLSFRTTSPYTFSSDVELDAVTAHDFNSDGHIDLAFADSFADKIGIMLGRENASFKSPVMYFIGLRTFPTTIVVGDFNNDGYSDVCVGSSSTSYINILHGNGNGTFGRRTRFTLPLEAGSGTIVVGDFNHDGRSDLAMLASYGSIDILLNKMNGTFEMRTIFVTSDDLHLIVADINNDSKLDLVASCTAQGTLYLLIGAGNGTFQAPVQLSTGRMTRPVAIAAGDFNHDNRTDLVTAYSRERSIGIFLGQGAGTFAEQKVYRTGLSSSPRLLFVGDVNDDEQLDLVVTKPFTRLFGIFLGVADGTFLKQMPFTVGPDDHAQTIIVGDFDEDGRSDLLIFTESLHSLFLALRTCRSDA